MSTFGTDPQRRALLDLLLREEGLEPLSAPKIGRREAADSVPLSFTQQQMWFLDQLMPGNPSYKMAAAVRFKGPLDVQALEKSFNEIVRRHESLRTTFAAVEGIPVQRITPALTLTLPVIDLMTIPETERAAQLMHLVTEEARRPYDLTKSPLLRLTLLKVGAEEHVLLLESHHIVMDGLSWEVLFRELAVLYEAFSTGRPAPLAELSLQYADFVHWQHERLQGDVLEQHLSYWKKQLDQAPHLLELPTDRPRPTAKTFRGASQLMVFPKSLTEDLKALSRHERVTLFMTFLAAFQLLLSRVTGQEDIVVGSPIAGRNRPEFEGMIGLFINTLVLRTDLSGNPSFRELLGRVRDVVLGAFAHQEVPFEKLMRELHPTRSLSRNTLFQVMLGFRQRPAEKNLKLAGLTVDHFPLPMEAAKFDLTLAVVERPERLSCSFSYDSDLFDVTSILRMMGHFQTLLEGIVANPDQCLATLPLLTNAERRQLLVEWNDTKRDYPQDRCVHQLFEAQVARTPEATAVMFEEERLSYQELDRRASQLARHLQALGVGRDVLVGIYMERSLEMVVGLLGILKAGGAYVPLEPNYPTDRLEMVLEDSQTRVLLSQQRLAETLPKHRAKVLCLDSDWEIISQESEEKPVVAVNADNLAYVIYTSGSTGKPKGVEITHRGLANFTTSACTAFELEPRDRVLQFASLSFDTAVEEIFPCLIRGATVVLRTDFMLDSVSLFLQKSRDWGITVLDLPTVYWHELTEQLCSQQLTIPEQLRLVIIGGERATPERLAQWQNCSGGHVQLLNTYGPTEATVVATMSELAGSAEVDTSTREVPIGRPIPNVQTYVLDRHLNPVPIGVSGELHVGGVGVGRGYLKSPELTAEKFIPNPFSNEPGARLYKTGDLARYRPDKNIEFLGRIDHQVKVRGFRIELGEVEAVLGQHPGARETAVMVREDELGNKRLVAYVVPSQEQVPTISELRSFLKAKLPEHMVPSAFVFLDALPLMPNGKVDRCSLPIPEQSRPELQETFLAPRTAAEKKIAEIWVELLKLEQVGVHDNFFDLGGHSLLAIKVVWRMRELGVDLPVRALFEAPTIAQLGTQIEAQTRELDYSKKGKTNYSHLIELHRQPNHKPIFCFPYICGVHGEYAHFLRLSRYLGLDYSFYGLQAKAADDHISPYATVEELAAKYVREIEDFEPNGPYYLLGDCAGATEAYETARQLWTKGKRVGLLMLLDAPGPYLPNQYWHVGSFLIPYLDRLRRCLQSSSVLVRCMHLAAVTRFHLKQSKKVPKSERWRYLTALAVGKLRTKFMQSQECSSKPSGQSEFRLSETNAQFFEQVQLARAHYRRNWPTNYGGPLAVVVNEQWYGFDRTFGWAGMAAGGIETHAIPGDHTSYMLEYVPLVADQLRACLEKAQKRDMSGQQVFPDGCSNLAKAILPS